MSQKATTANVSKAEKKANEVKKAGGLVIENSQPSALASMKEGTTDFTFSGQFEVREGTVKEGANKGKQWMSLSAIFLNDDGKEFLVAVSFEELKGLSDGDTYSVKVAKNAAGYMNARLVSE